MIEEAAAPVGHDVARPGLHIRPPGGWLNDPNGLCRIDGTYHVFYQYNPHAPVHGDIHWGHASSVDLLRWVQEPVALQPRPGADDHAGCWSGCIVDDGGVPTAVYTGVGEQRNAQVLLARSDRTLRTWVQDDAPRIGQPDDPAITDVRDPFVFTLEGRRYAVQGAGHRCGLPQLLLYGCHELDTWTFLGPLLTTADPVAAAVAPANIWECPNLFPTAEGWVVVLSLWRELEGGHELAGVRYLLGDLCPRENGLTFVARSGGEVDSGPTFYAPQVLVEPDRVLLWGWAWEGANRPGTELDWAGVLTFPRELEVRNGVLHSRPAAELVSLRGEPIPLGPGGVVGASAFEIEAIGPIRLSLIDEEAGRDETVVEEAGPVRVLVDASMVEVFGPGASRTSRAYPTATSRWVVAAGDQTVQLWRLSLR